MVIHLVDVSPQKVSHHARVQDLVMKIDLATLPEDHEVLRQIRDRSNCQDHENDE